MRNIFFAWVSSSFMCWLCSCGPREKIVVSSDPHLLQHHASLIYRKDEMKINEGCERNYEKVGRIGYVCLKIEDDFNGFMIEPNWVHNEPLREGKDALIANFKKDFIGQIGLLDGLPDSCFVGRVKLNGVGYDLFKFDGVSSNEDVLIIYWKDVSGKPTTP